MKQWHFYDKVYRIWVELMIGPIDKFYDELDLVGYQHINEVKQHHAHKGMMLRVYPEDCTSDTNMAFIWMKEFSLSTLIHEATHLMTITFDDKSIPMNHENTEAMAFYVEYWCHEIMAVRKRNPNGRSPKYAKS